MMLLIYIGCKLASQQHLDGASKIAHICHSISGGFKFKKQHLEFLVQFVRQKSNKVLNMEAELNEMREQLHAHKSNNKITFQEQILVEKRDKLKSILSYALQVVNGLTVNVKEVVEPSRTRYAQGDANKVRNYFFFSGSESGLEFNAAYD